MSNLAASLPKWFLMIIIVFVVATIIYKLITAKSIKAGPVEIESEDDENKES
jgi:hypothetical protein